MVSARSLRGRQVLDAAAYGITAAFLSFLSGVVVSLLISGGWVVVEAVMFIEGWLLFGFGTFKLRPTPPWKGEKGGVRGKVRSVLSNKEGTDLREDTPVESIAYRVPGLEKHVPAANNRFSMGTKTFVASLTVLLASFLLERVVVV